MYEMTMRFTQLVGMPDGAIRVVVTDTDTGREVTNQVFINRPLVTAENLKEEIIFAAHKLCGYKEGKKPARKTEEPKEKDVATNVVKKEVKKNG